MTSIKKSKEIKKSQEQLEIEKQKFFKCGGEIQIIPSGVSGLNKQALSSKEALFRNKMISRKPK